MKTALENYQARMRRVLDHIDAHLDGELDLDTVSAVAAFSKFHFHRQFSATFGLSVHRYVQLARLKRASHRLADAQGPNVTEIAMEAGYDAPDAFARAFRRRFGQSPSAFRKTPDWVPWLAAFAPLDLARSKLMQTIYTEHDVTIREVPPTPVAIFEHRGDRAGIPDTIARFVAWRKANGLSPETSPTFNVFHSEREPADPAAYAMDICVGTGLPIAEEAGIKAGLIPGGRCAVMRIDAASHNLEPPALYLYRDWLPASGEEAGDFPLYCRRHLVRSDEGGVHQAFGELFLPLR
jgi:AraC family transcriptional regulator